MAESSWISATHRVTQVKKGWISRVDMGIEVIDMFDLSGVLFIYLGAVT